MANKLYAMEQLTEEVAKDVAASPQEWMRFLNTASRLYKCMRREITLIILSPIMLSSRNRKK